MRRTPILIAGFFPSIVIAQTGSGRAFALSDWYRVTTVRQPALSPDGRRVAFTVTTVREAENKRHSEVWVASTDGGAPARFTSPGTESSAPRWSADGKLLVFSSNRPGSPSGLWALRMDEPAGEAAPIELPPAGSMPADRTFTIWSDTPEVPDPSGPDPYAGMGNSRPPFGAITKPADPKRFDGRQFTDFPFRVNDQGFIPPRKGPIQYVPDQLYRQQDGGAKQQLTTTRYRHDNEAVSPDGQWIAFTSDPDLRTDSVVARERDSLGLLPYDRARDEAPRNNADIFVIPVKPCAGGDCPARSLGRIPGNEGALAWSPDSKRISWLARPSPYSSTRLYVADASGGTPVNLLGDWRYEPDGYVWLPGGDILLWAQTGGRNAIYQLTPGSRTPREIVGGRRRLAEVTVNATGTRVAFVGTSVTRPTELFVTDADGKNERQLTHFNDALNRDVAWSDAERFTYKSVGGREIEGWLMKPFGYRAGVRYPLVLYIHGGPHSPYTEGWFDEFQNLTGAGFMVLFTNPRGSTGYGADFTYSIRGRWGDEDYQDLMKAVDLMVLRPDVDSTKLGVTGGSYGGFMTGWITGHNNRFHAAEVDRADMNWGSWYGGSDAAQGLTESEIFGKPWENWKGYDAVSPIRFVDKVRTPTLVVHSEEDYRVTIGQGDEWFTALKKQGVPVEYIRYPRSSHELSRSGEPWLLVDRLGRLRDWFSYWLKPPAPPTP